VSEFVDHYEVLQLSQSADFETIERVYRLLAKRFHPDNQASGDEERFRAVRTAYEVLVDPERRAEYDVRFDQNTNLHWQIFEQDTALGNRDDDQRIFSGVLSLLYAARRQDPELGGLGSLHLERMLGVPREHLEFPLWYLKKKGLIEILHNGQLAITIDGIDQLTAKGMPLPDDRLLSRIPSEDGDGASANGEAPEPAPFEKAAVG
jgi:hypothetical protein